MQVGGSVVWTQTKHYGNQIELSSLDRRKRTIRYMCMAEHLPMAIDAAKSLQAGPES